MKIIDNINSLLGDDLKASIHPKAKLKIKEKELLVANCDRFELLKHSTVNPYAFTEQGVSMLSAVLRSETAVKVSIQIINTFVRIRRFIQHNAKVFERLESVECRQMLFESETIAEISKERIRRAGKKILEGECHEVWAKDVGFRVLKVDSSNMADVYYTPDAINQRQLSLFTDNIKPDRKPEDLIFQVLLDWGVDLSLPIRKEIITTEHTEYTEKDKNNFSVSSVFSVVKKSFEVFFVDENALVACFDTGVNEELVKELAGFEPLRVVFRDTGFVSDAVKINVEQIFKQMSPHTEMKCI